MNFVQGGPLAVCSKSDMVQLLLNHPNMKTLRVEAGIALVQRQTGDAAGMALAVQAATAPTEGQRVFPKRNGPTTTIWSIYRVQTSRMSPTDMLR